MIRKVATSIDELSETQLQTAEELATFFCNVKGKVYEGQDIDITTLFDICTSVFEIDREKMKGAIKPYHKHYERHAQLAFLWACKFYSNEMFAGADYLGCYQRSTHAACREFGSHLHYGKENCKFKYEKRRKMYADKLLLIVAACNDLCPNRKNLFVAAGVVPPTPESKPQQPKDYLKETVNRLHNVNNAQQQVKDNLAQAAKFSAEADRINRETAVRLRLISDKLEGKKTILPTNRFEANYVKLISQGFSFALIPDDQYMEESTSKRLERTFLN